MHAHGQIGSKAIRRRLGASGAHWKKALAILCYVSVVEIGVVLPKSVRFKADNCSCNGCGNGKVGGVNDCQITTLAGDRHGCMFRCVISVRTVSVKSCVSTGVAGSCDGTVDDVRICGGDRGEDGSVYTKVLSENLNWSMCYPLHRHRVSYINMKRYDWRLCLTSSTMKVVPRASKFPIFGK